MIIEGYHWEIDDDDLVIGMMVHGGETVEWIIPLAALGDAIKAAQEARESRKDISTINMAKRFKAAPAANVRH